MLVIYSSLLYPLFSQQLPQQQPQSALEKRFAAALRDIGASEYDSAIAALEQIIAESPDFQPAYRKLADAYILADNVETARAKFNHLLQESPENAFANYVLARMHVQQNQYDAALEKLKACIEKQPGFSPAYSTVGGLPEVFHAMADVSGGKRFFEDLIARQPENAFAWYGLGRLLSFENEWDAAEKMLKKSIELQPLQEESYATLQNIYENNGNYKMSIFNSQRLLQAAFQMNSLESAANALIRQGGINFRLGNFRSALEDMINAITLSRQIGAKRLEGFALLTAGAIYATLGNYDRALEHFTRALEFMRLLNLRRSEIRTLMNIGLVNKDTQNYPEALRYLEMALEKAQSDAYVYERGSILVGLAETSENLDNHPQAIAYYRRALDIFESIQSEIDIGYALSRLAEVFYKQGKYRQALQEYQTALRLGKQSNDAQILWESYAGLGACYEKLDAVESAIQHYQLAIAGYDSIRQNLDIETLTQSFLEDKYQVYPSLVHLLAQLQRYEEAFRYAEQYKAKNLLQILSKGQFLFNELLPDTVKFELAGIREQIAQARSNYAKALEQPRDPQNAQRLLQLDQKITGLELAKSALIRRIRENYPDFYQLTSADPATIPHLQQNVLQPGQLLIEYIVGPERTSVFSIAHDRVTYSFVPHSRDSLASMISAMSALFGASARGERMDMLFSPDQADFSVPPAYRLGQALLSPVEELLPASNELIIVPDDLLCYVPFEALITDTSRITSRYDFANAEFLVQNKIISYSSSASVLGNRFAGDIKPAKTLFAMGNPAFVDDASGDTAGEGFRGTLLPLPHSETEVQAVGDLLNAASGDILTRNAATESAFYERAAAYQIIHVASHFVINDQDPLYSRLALSEESGTANDGFLYTYEVFGIKLHADLVTLSACNTALGKLSKGEGLIGINRAFLTAGVPSMVVSLWSVDDEATSRIMTRFYENLAKGLDKNRALQLAKVNFLNSADARHKDPFFWAPFILMGDLQPVAIAQSGFDTVHFVPLSFFVALLLVGYWLFRRRGWAATR